MPKVDCKNLPADLKAHLRQRIEERSIGVEGLTKIMAWLSIVPDAPEDYWYKDFGDLYLVGFGAHPASVLLKTMVPLGQKIE